MDELNLYRKQAITNFLTEILEIDRDTAEKDSNEILKSISEQSLSKLVHFFDCMTQCTTGSLENKCSGNSNCGSCCGKCNCKN